MPIKVLGAGFGRTGTNSLKLALEMLGFGPCYHMYEVSSGDIDIWNEAIDGKNVNWQVLFKEYQSAVDWPAISFLPQLLREYPDAKVILTTRDPEDWFESASNTIFKAMVLGDKIPHKVGRKKNEMARRLILDDVFSGRYADKDYCIDVYNQHVRDIAKLVPSDNLLNFRVSDGWQHLCEFLEVPVPCDDFPKTNDRNSFRSAMSYWVK